MSIYKEKQNIVGLNQVKMGKHFKLNRVDFLIMSKLNLQDISEVYAFEEVRSRGGWLYELVYISCVGEENITYIGVLVEHEVCRFVVSASQTKQKVYGNRDIFSIITDAVETLMVELSSIGLANMKSEPLYQGESYSGLIPLNM